MCSNFVSCACVRVKHDKFIYTDGKREKQEEKMKLQEFDEGSQRRTNNVKEDSEKQIAILRCAERKGCEVNHGNIGELSCQNGSKHFEQTGLLPKCEGLSSACGSAKMDFCLETLKGKMTDYETIYTTLFRSLFQKNRT